MTRGWLWQLTQLLHRYCFLSQDICFSTASDNTSLCSGNVSYHFVCLVCRSLWSEWESYVMIWYIHQSVPKNYGPLNREKIRKIPFSFVKFKITPGSLQCRQFALRLKGERREYFYLSLQIRASRKVRKCSCSQVNDGLPRCLWLFIIPDKPWKYLFNKHLLEKKSVSHSTAWLWVCIYWGSLSL